MTLNRVPLYQRDKREMHPYELVWDIAPSSRPKHQTTVYAYTLGEAFKVLKTEVGRELDIWEIDENEA